MAGGAMAVVVRHLTARELEAGLDEIGRSPKDGGALEMIVRRPRVGEREILREGQLDPAEGLAGDSWKIRSSRRTADGTPHPDRQLNLMNSRVAALVSQDTDRWHLAAEGEAAARLAEGRAEPVHLLLSDVVMPGMSGQQLAERLALARPGVKVNKPFTAAALLQKVREVLDSQG